MRRERTRYRLPTGGIADRTSLMTTARLVGSRLGGADPIDRRIGERVRLSIDHAAHDAAVHEVVVRARRGWVDTGLVVRRGEQLTVLAAGTLWAAKALAMGVEPKVGLWLRVGEGAVVSMVGTAMVLTADTDDRLRVLAAEPGILDHTGDFDPTVPRMPLTGEFDVVIVRWAGDPTAGLAAAAIADPELFAAAYQRHQHPDRTPGGWNYHPRTGAAEIFQTQHRDGNQELRCLTHRDVGILRHPIDVALTDDVELTWSWLVQSLPSRIAENIAPTHDYLSVAIEFDDGRDLSWIWSSELPVGTVFGCPLTYWRDRETHLVIRCGTDELGRWTDEQRTISADVAAALDSPFPTRIVAIWLIANSTFQGGVGAFRLRDLRIDTGTTTIAVGTPTDTPKETRP